MVQVLTMLASLAGMERGAKEPKRRQTRKRKPLQLTQKPWSEALPSSWDELPGQDPGSNKRAASSCAREHVGEAQTSKVEAAASTESR